MLHEKIPETMTAVRLYSYGGPESLKVEKHPVPTPREDEILVKVRATSVSWWDVSYRKNAVPSLKIPGRSKLLMPQQLGREAAGDVVALGRNVNRFQVGDKVVMMANPACGRCTFCVRGSDNVCPSALLPAHNAFGGYAEYIVLPQYAALKSPPNLSYEKLACLLWAYPTVLTALKNSAKLQAGESILVTGASGGLGIASVQLAKLAGATPIIALSSVPEKKAQILAAGADVVLNWRDADIEAQIRAQTIEGIGTDVVIDNVGGAMAELALNVTRMNGRVLLLAPMGGEKLEVNILKFFVHNINLLGCRSATRRNQELVLELAAAKKIDPIISHRFPLTQVSEGHKVLESGQHMGKIVITMDEA